MGNVSQVAFSASGAADELPASSAAVGGVHGHAAQSECFEVAAGRSLRHLELFGELAGGHLAPSLEDEEGGDQAVGTHRFDLLMKSGQ